ncbi:hypothetical protein HOY80DRAFT_1002329 [Tuber brumale]|nr:hypothetical protein HOY80DRAFT_1002329 [Tuber brumale]
MLQKDAPGGLLKLTDKNEYTSQLPNTSPYGAQSHNGSHQMSLSQPEGIRYKAIMAGLALVRDFSAPKPNSKFTIFSERLALVFRISRDTSPGYWDHCKSSNGLSQVEKWPARPGPSPNIQPDPAQPNEA